MPEPTPLSPTALPAADARPHAGRPSPACGLLTKHGQLVRLLIRQPDVRIRDLAERIGTTERTTQLILGELIDAGVVRRTKVGRRNTYRVIPPVDPEIRRSLEHELEVMADLLHALRPHHRAAL